MTMPVEVPEGWERVLLVGGPFHFRVAVVKAHAYEIHVAMPVDLKVHPVDEAINYHGEIINVDMPMARYTRNTEFVWMGETLGWFFGYQEDR